MINAVRFTADEITITKADPSNFTIHNYY